eukprot:3156766-Rhodomonas_salina.2
MHCSSLPFRETPARLYTMPCNAILLSAPLHIFSWTVLPHSTKRWLPTCRCSMDCRLKLNAIRETGARGHRVKRGGA